MITIMISFQKIYDFDNCKKKNKSKKKKELKFDYQQKNQ